VDGVLLLLLIDVAVVVGVDVDVDEALLELPVFRDRLLDVVGGG
jgi:hypothetical protein